MLSLRRLGKVLHLSRSRNLIVKLEDPQPPVGEDVVDSKLRRIGRLAEVIGPVRSPYATIKPAIPEAASLVGKAVYCTD